MAGERLQKVLAAAGVASRRESENWIRAGRITVNGRVAELGTRVDEDDTIAIDGRKLRLERSAPEDLVLIYHRPTGEPLKSETAAPGETAVSTYEHLPQIRGRRWLPLSPLAPTDGGLEVFTTDGKLREAAGRQHAEIVSVYAVRIAGEPSEEWLASLAGLAAAQPERPFEILAATLAGGEGRNRWIELQVRRAHGRDLRNLVLAAGFEVSRVLRIQYGPVILDRNVPRARSMELKGEARDAIYRALGLVAPSDAARDAARAARPPSRGEGAGSRGRSGGAGRGPSRGPRGRSPRD
jgi:23S rRNA pseudouridine2605 synthase